MCLMRNIFFSILFLLLICFYFDKQSKGQDKSSLAIKNNSSVWWVFNIRDTFHVRIKEHAANQKAGEEQYITKKENYSFHLLNSV